jgi:predicted nucleic acid-binding protein
MALRVSASAEGDLIARAHQVIDALDLIPVSRETFRVAGLLMPAELRSLDAIHLAVAMGLGDDLDGMVTYDDRLARAAQHWGLPVISPA